MMCPCPPDPYLTALQRIAGALEQIADAVAPVRSPGSCCDAPSADMTSEHEEADRTPPKLSLEDAIVETIRPLISDVFGAFVRGGRR